MLFLRSRVGEVGQEEGRECDQGWLYKMRKYYTNKVLKKIRKKILKIEILCLSKWNLV